MKRSPLLTPVLLLAAAALALCPVLHAQDVAPVDAPAGPKVTAIDVQYSGPPTIDRSRILGLLTTQVGQPFSVDDTERDIRTLIGSGEVENARFLTEPSPGGVRVIVVVQTRAATGGVRFQGNTAIDSRRLAKEVPLAVGEVASEVKLLEGKQKIEKLYAGRGFPDVRVSYQVNETSRPGFQDIVYTIEEGGKSWVRDIRFEGVTSAKASEIKRKLDTEERNWLSWLTGKGKIDNLKLQSDMGKVERVLQDKGHMKARVVEVRRERVGAGKVDLVFVVDEGGVYEVNSVRISGMRIFQTDEIMPDILLKAGSPYSGSNVAADEKVIRDYYGSKGYADARVDTQVQPAGANRVDVTYAVTEGEKSFVGRVNISGNVQTKDKVVRREVTLAPGDEFNTVEMEATRRRLRNTGYFSQVDVMPTDSGEPGYRDLSVNVVEQKTGSLVFGVGFSSIDELVGRINVTQTNFDATEWPGFTGGGQKFNASLLIGTKRKDLVIGLEEPYFRDQRLALGGELFLRDLSFLSDYYTQRNIGGNIYVRRPVTEHSHIQLTNTTQQVSIEDIEDDASDAIRAEEGDYLQDKIELSWVRETRDDILIPRRGGRFEVAGRASFIDAETYGFEAGGVHFWQLPADLIFSLQGRVNVVDGSNVPIFERLFLGGANTLRGYEYRDVGPKDENGEPLGGQTSAFLSAEITFPIIESVRGAVFYDVGFVNEDSFDFGTSNLGADVGVGLRLFLPFGPLALDFGIPLETDGYQDDSGQFNFNVGYKF